MLAGAFDDDIRYQIKYIAVPYIREERCISSGSSGRVEFAFFYLEFLRYPFPSLRW